MVDGGSIRYYKKPLEYNFKTEIFKNKKMGSLSFNIKLHIALNMTYAKKCELKLVM
jgi:hypothetical protein